ncbi:MAG: CoA pyrophosphatase [Syntrophomonadaceae bacterium]|nr:CoA pyrophosphatase [Syntrophomonadaceae bacterium]
MSMHAYELLKGRKAGILGQGELQAAAVVVPLVEHEGQVKVLFEERSLNLNRQPGEICFPGGGIEPSDMNPAQAALRETCEELGIGSGDIECIAPLDVFLTPYNLVVYPYLAQIRDYSLIQPNYSEIKSVFCVPLDYLRSTQPIVQELKVVLSLPEDFPFDLIPGGRNYPWKNGVYQVYFYIYNEWVIWGLTARILNNFLTLLDRVEQSLK